MKNLYEAILGEKNRTYYLKKFEQFDEKGPGIKVSWNWSAFFFGFFWALYRKMYLWGLFIISITLLTNFIASRLQVVFIGLMVSIIFPIFANSLYHESVKSKIADANCSIKDESELLAFLRYKGGVNAYVIWIPISGFFLLFLIYFLPIFTRMQTGNEIKGSP